MKKLATLVLTAAMLASTPLIADDLGPDQALELVEQGKIKHFRDLNKIAQDLHPGATIKDTELESSFGRYVYTLEMRDSNRDEWDVHLNAETGEVLKNRLDRDD